MTTAILNLDRRNTDQVDTALGWLRHVLRSPDAVPPASIEAAIASLTKPAKPEWIMARVAALLQPYYERDIPQGVRILEMEDWSDALSGLPQWAIQKAAQWWKSEHNENRRKRPLEGDIVARVRVEMSAVNAAKIRLEHVNLKRQLSSTESRA